MLHKKVFGLTLIFILFFTAINYASVTSLSETYVCVNGGTGKKTTNVPVTTIIPGIHKILSISVSPADGGTQASLVAIYDAISTTQLTNALMKGECEAVANSSNDRVFAYPKSLSNGLTIIQSAYTVVTIEYTR